jgi:Glycosyl hydrolase catalytic core
MRYTYLLLAASAAVVMASTSTAAPRMGVGFQDNVNFEWNHDRAKMLGAAADAHASLIRVSVDWWQVAPRRPRDPSSYLDPVYRFQSLDELTRRARLLGLQVMFTIWGTPSWANGGAAPNRPPSNADDLRAFAQALSARYSGRHAGLPFVGYYTIWNESNMGRFLSPQYDSAGRPVSPRLYARLFRSASDGIRSGNPLAKVGIGETSSHGRLTAPHVHGVQASVAPGRFAQLLSRADPHLRFDAWSLHPYPTSRWLPPTDRTLWPNVTMTQLGRFERSIDGWFGRRHIPIWITEYGYESKPADPRGVTEAQQASFMRQAFQMAQSDPNVTMFVWFMLRDDPTSAWQSGLIAKNGRHKPSYAMFSSFAAAVDMRKPLIDVRGGTRNPTVTFSALELTLHSEVGATVGATVRVYDRNRLVGTTQPVAPLGIDGYVTLVVPVVVERGHRYQVLVNMNNIHGDRLNRVATIVGT